MVQALVLLISCACAFALNPDLEVSQYAHKSWTIREGFFKSAINAIAQTPDGYLWLGTDFGLLRFDGVKADPWVPPSDQHLPSNGIRKLFVSRDGTLWIGTTSGLASWKDGRLRPYEELSGQSVSSLIEDHEGSMWAGGVGALKGKLCAIQAGSVQCDELDDSLGRGVLSIYESVGNLWVGGTGHLWRWKPGPPKLYPVPEGSREISDLIQGDNGALWLATRLGIGKVVDGKVEASPLAGVGDFGASKLLRDRQGGVWIGTREQGLVHVHRGRTDQFSRPDGLSGDFIFALFEDHEGNIWAATSNGLDRFRDLAVSSFSLKQGVPALVSSVLAGQDGSIWLNGSGLSRWNRGEVTDYRQSPLRPLVDRNGARRKRTITGTGLPDEGVQSIFEDSRGRIWASPFRGAGYLENNRFVSSGARSGFVNAMAEDKAGNLWMANQSIGLIRVSPEGRVQEQISWTELGQKTPITSLGADPRDGGLWIGFFQAGLVHFQNGQVRASYAAGDGLGGGGVNSLWVDRERTVWVATNGGLSRLKNGRVTTLTTKNGLPCELVHWSMEDDDHALWLYLACGVARIPSKELDAWAAAPDHIIRATVFDSSDGVRLLDAPTRYKPAVSKSKDGKLWFTQQQDGLSLIDPKNLPFNKLPPPVQVEQVIADHKTYPTNAAVKLPPLTRDLQIDYTALSFVAPEKVRFRYKLEGRDRDWTDAGTRRQAFYDELRPRSYRFRVMAANNSGVWNEAGASFDFSVAPAYYQTRWFQALFAAAVLALLSALYRLRLLYLKRQFEVRLEARVAERTRIARDLHDTLLQSFQGVLLKFSALKYIIRDRPAEVEEMLERLIEQARQAVTEGRDAVQGLRSSIVVTNDLARAIGTFGEGLAADHTGANGPQFRIHVEGKSRDLPPLVRDEVYHVACETLRNAFRHAQARRIEVEIRYDPREFRFRVVDNGKGIDPAIVSAGGAAGHHGLPGIHERAELAGGKLSVWSRLDSGTEIELTIPGSIAYPKPRSDRRPVAS